MIQAEPTVPIPRAPKYKVEETIVSYRGKLVNDYISFPALIRTAENLSLLNL